MSNKDWLAHVDAVLDGRIKPILEQIKYNKKPDKPKGRAFRGTVRSNSEKNIDHLHNQLLLVYRSNEYTQKEFVMEDELSHKQTDLMITTLFNKFINQKSQEKYAEMSEDYHPDIMRERKLFILGNEFILSAEHDLVSDGKIMIDAGYSVNFQHPKTMNTALHVAAQMNAFRFARMLVETEKINYLLKNNRSYYPTDYAYKYIKDLDLAEKIKQYTLEQAETEGEKIELYSIHNMY